MSKKIVLAGLLVSVLGCGGEPVSEDFSGRWNGNLRWAAPGFAPASFTASLVIQTREDTLTAIGVCPDGSGTVIATGEGRFVRWEGSVVCNYASQACATTRLEYTSATISLTATNSIVIAGTGRLSGCSTLPSTISVTFDGAR